MTLTPSLQRALRGARRRSANGVGRRGGRGVCVLGGLGGAAGTSGVWRRETILWSIIRSLAAAELAFNGNKGNTFFFFEKYFDRYCNHTQCHNQNPSCLAPTCCQRAAYGVPTGQQINEDAPKTAEQSKTAHMQIVYWLVRHSLFKFKEHPWQSNRLTQIEQYHIC